MSSRSASEPSQARLDRFLAGVRPPDDSARLVRNASILKQMGRTHMAVKELEEACRRDPGDLRLVDALARCYEELGAWSQAEDLYRQALDLNPGNPALANNRCFAHYQAGNLAKAEKCFREALKHNPHNNQARNNLGLLLARQSRETEALALWREALGEGEAVHRLNQALASLGKAPAAVAQASKAAPAKAPIPAPAAGTAAAAAAGSIKESVAVASGQTEPKNWLARHTTSPTGPAPGVSAPRAPAEAPFSPKTVGAQPPETARAPEPSPSAASGKTVAAAVKAPAGRLPVLTARDLVDTRIQVLNGNGIQGLARRQRSWLELEGHTVASIGNHVDFGKEYTEIRYRPEALRVAQVLGAKFFRTSNLIDDPGLGDQEDVRVVLGRDLLQKEDILAKLAD